MSEWKPGDVAMVWRTDGPHTVAIVRHRREAGGRVLEFAYSSGGYDLVDDMADGWTASPLVVIDPEDREQVERLAQALASTYDDDHADYETEHMQAALREFASPTPPKPEVYEHLVYQQRGKTSEAVCGKVWIPTPDVTVVGRCPECVKVGTRWTA